MCGRYDDFKAYFIGDSKPVQVKQRKNIIVSAKRSQGQPNMNLEEWLPKGLYKDWFGFTIGEEKEIKFTKTRMNWGLKAFQKNYQIRKDLKKPLNFSNSIKIKTKCIAITPNGQEKNRTHAAGIWKIEGM